jgi:tyrosyl-DNA phosphodiesterase-1
MKIETLEGSQQDWCMYINSRSRRRAIALSLKENTRSATRPTNQAEVIDLVDSDNDEDFQAQLRAATEASKLDTPFASPTTEPSLDPQSGPPSTFLSQRVQLEKERLARQKRLHPGILGDGYSAQDEIVTKQPRLSPTGFAAISPTVSGGSTVTDETQLFFRGELRQTAVQHAHPRKDGKPTFRLTDVLGKVSSVFILVVI